MKFIRLLAAALAAMMLTVGAFAADTTNTYDPEINYMEKMLDAAKDGSYTALNMGQIYEQQRNLKIISEDMDYGTTEFFVSGRSGDEILDDLTMYNTHPEMTYRGRLRITGYDACYRCCGKTDGITASGTVAAVGRTVAMRGVPYGTKIYIEGLGYYTVEDTGCAYGVVDVFCSNHTQCYAITGYYDVYFIN